MTTLTDTQTMIRGPRPTLRIQQPLVWRAWIQRWAPVLITAVLLCVTVAHLVDIWDVKDPDEQWGFLLKSEAKSAWKPWSQAVYRQLLLVGSVLLGVGLLGLAAGRRLPWPRFVSSLVLAGVIAIIGAQLRLHGFYDLGLGLPTWTWQVPLRVGALAVALGAMLVILRPGLRWPRVLLLVGTVAVALLWLIPRKAAPTFHPATLHCAFESEHTRPHPACRIHDPANFGMPVVPLLRALSTSRDRALIRDLISTRLDRLEGLSHNPARSTLLKRLHANHTRVSLWHYDWQEIRLIGFVVLVLMGLPLGLLLVWRRVTPGRIPLAVCAAVALICATGLSPAWSYLSAWRHVPGALLFPVAAPLAALAVARLTEPCPPE